MALKALIVDVDGVLVDGGPPEFSFVRSAGIRVYLATNQEQLRAAYLMAKWVWLNMWMAFSIPRAWARKPDMQFFARVQPSIAPGGEEMLLIDDSHQNIEAVRRAGWDALHWRKQSSPKIVRSFSPPQHR